MCAVDISKQYMLSGFLPGDKPFLKSKLTEMETNLNGYKILLSGLDKALEEFQNMNLEKFDALVGENACEIRAFLISKFAKDYLLSETLPKPPANASPIRIRELRGSVAMKIAIIDELLPQIPGMGRSKNSLGSLFEKKQLDISLNCDEAFLLESYLLTLTKVEKERGLVIKEVGDPKKLLEVCENSKNMKISNTFLSNLEQHLRRLLSTASVEYMRRLTTSLKDDTLKMMTSETYTYKHLNAWPCVPMFWTYDALLKMAINENITIVVQNIFLEKDQPNQNIDKAVKAFMVFEVAPVESKEVAPVGSKEAAPEGSEYEFQESSLDLNKIDFNDKKPVVVIQGIITDKKDQLISVEAWKEKMRTQLRNAILCGAANHRQFPADEQDKWLEEKLLHEESDPDKQIVGAYNKFKSLAETEGYSSENPTSFFIQHVFASVIGNIIKKRQVELAPITTTTCS